jgi:hypothetical protein
MEDHLPPIPEDLLAALDKLFPERSPELGEAEGQLRWRGGQRSVIRFLKEHYARQNENITDRQIL